MKRTAAHLLTLFVMSLLCACQEDRQMNRLFSEADALMDVHPDSTLAMLENVSEEVKSGPRSQQMRYQLLHGKAMNKAYVNFTSDSTMLEVADYYEHSGTANEKVLAYYLLGCAYRDLNEAPLAIECYKDAVSKADTASADCDFKCLMSIYGQMASLYDRQMMPVEEIAALENMTKLAQRSNDSVMLIKSTELRICPYNQLHDTAKIYSLTRDVFEMYMQRNDKARAARVLPVAIFNRICEGQYEMANQMMQFFEKESGYFDAEGNISPRFSHYYNSRALYYSGLNQQDSAEHYFRKLLQCGHVAEASRGLMEIYRKQGQWDSVLHYNSMYERAYDKFYTSRRTESVRNTSLLYDYARSQRLAQEKKDEAKRSRRVTWTIAVMSIILMFGICYWHRQQKRKKDERIQTVLHDYLQLSARYDKEHHDLELSKQDFSQFVSNKEAELTRLADQLAESRKQLESVQTVIRIEELYRSKIVEDFKRMVIPGPNQKFPTDKQWEELIMLIKECNYPLYAKIVENCNLSQRELHVTLLTSLNFTVGDIANLFRTTPQSIVNSKGKANKKLFQEKGGKTFGSQIHDVR